MRTRTSVAARFLIAGTLLASILGAAVATAPAAGASVAAQSTTCKLKAIAKFKPGLTLSEQQQKIKASGTLSNCSGGGVSSAVFSGKGGGSMSCTSGSGTATLNVTWNTNETSVVSLTVDVGAMSFSGMVTSGKFAGEPVSATNVSITPVKGDCFFSPVTKAKAKATASL
jgi:hypothetical protein